MQSILHVFKCRRIRYVQAITYIRSFVHQGSYRSYGQCQSVPSYTTTTIVALQQRLRCDWNSFSMNDHHHHSFICRWKKITTSSSSSSCSDIIWRSYFTSIIEPNNSSSTTTTSSGVPEYDDDDDSNDLDDVMEKSISSSNNKIIIERPCSIILAEEFISIPPLGYEMTTSASSSSLTNTSIQKKKFKSWHRSFSNLFPHHYGIAYTKWSISDPQNYEDVVDTTNNNNNNKITFDMALSIMKSDFRTLSTLIPPPILITRGPVLSWMAQFYLESLPLAGLIMIDPIPFSSERAYQLYQSHYEEYYKRSNTTSDANMNDMILSKEYLDVIQDYSEHWDHWTLKIEAGSIPMMILSTKVSESMNMNDIEDMVLHLDENGDVPFQTSNSTGPTNVEDIHLWREYAEQIAQRHTSNTGSTNNNSVVPVLDIDPNNIKQCSSVIHDWIHDKVL